MVDSFQKFTEDEIFSAQIDNLPPGIKTLKFVLNIGQGNVIKENIHTVKYVFCLVINNNGMR